MTPEFSRPYRLDALPKTAAIEADAAERSALAQRFGLVAIDSLAADLAIERSNDAVTVAGTLRAAVTQTCVATGAPLAARLDEPFRITFAPQPEAAPDAELELGETEMDLVFHDGQSIDLGEAVAETLALALDPYPRAPEAEARLRDAGVKAEGEAGPFGALAGLRDLLKK